MLRNSPNCLKRTIGALRSAPEGALLAAEVAMRWDESICGSVLPEGKDLRHRSILIATINQFTAAALLVELDGVASRLVLYPPDLSFEHLAHVARAAEIEVIVTDRPAPEVESPPAEWLAPTTWRRKSENPLALADCETEWVLLTSGTTGRPKLVAHTLSTLAGAIGEERTAAKGIVWSTFYDIRRFGGLQIFLRAALTGASLVLSSAQESTADFLARTGARGVTHISGTPSHWRRAAMSIAAGLISPVYVRLSGEIADQAILNHLQLTYPKAKIAHAFATTEAGVVFTVNDGLMGFPLNVLRSTPNVDLKIENDSLLVRSKRTARCYLGDGSPVLKDRDGFVNTGDVLEERRGRFYFAGRGDGVINVGGKKVHPEEVEAVINGHPEVQVSLVRTKKSAIVGAVVVADVVLKNTTQSGTDGTGELHSDILRLCREALDTYKVPASINFVRALPVAESGKLLRLRA
jgi:acyl-coenzyme A synthetase/AMP-(fatty) acid ligase